MSSVFENTTKPKPFNDTNLDNENGFRKHMHLTVNQLSFPTVRCNKPFDRPVVRTLYISGENTRRELSHTPVILYAFTAFSFARTGFIGTITAILVRLEIFAFHKNRTPVGHWRFCYLVYLGSCFREEGGEANGCLASSPFFTLRH